MALDDFGTGLGSFTYLRQPRLRYLKIDMSFVRGLVESSDDQRVVGSITDVARQFGLRVIAEGVETAPTLDRRFGVGYVQGFLLGKPAFLADA